jgi:hypothetical protein
MHRILALVAGTCVLFGASRAEAAGERTWTDYQGTQVKARFLTITDGVVRMRQGRKPIAIPFHELSAEDREFIRNELREKGEENLVPTIGELREWTAHGETFEARFVGPLKNDIIVLRNERPVTMPFASFSEDDQNYVRQQLTAKGQVHLIPSAKSEAEGPEGGVPLAGGPAGSFGASPFRSPFPGTSAAGMHGAGPAEAASAGGGSVPTYQPFASAAGGAASGAQAAGGAHGAAANPFGGSGSVPTYNPSAAASTASGHYDPFAGSHSATGGASSAGLSIPQIPSFPSASAPAGPETLGGIKFYKYCKNCGAQYSMDATHCTKCSGGVRWRRYSIFGALAGAIAAIIGVVVKAIRS